MGSTFGRLLQIHTFGESHGKGIGVVIENFPSNFPIDVALIQQELQRRRPGQSALTTSRNEKDQVEILSGIFEGRTTGAPIALWIANQDARSEDYQLLKDVFRPSHADYTYWKKYGIRDYRGGGRASARETAARVAAGALAKQWLKQQFNIQILAWVQQIYTIAMPSDYEPQSLQEVEQHPTRCPHLPTAQKMAQQIQMAKQQGDSLGGIIRCKVLNVPAGWGEPTFDKLEARLAYAMLSIPATKGFEIGSGFQSVLRKGSEHNDPFYIDPQGKIQTETNHSGGVQGGISNGMPIYFNVAFKPPATIQQPQKTITQQGKTTLLAPKGRHDPCVVPRAVPIVEAMTALTLMDFALLQQSKTW